MVEQDPFKIEVASSTLVEPNMKKIANDILCENCGTILKKDSTGMARCPKCGLLVSIWRARGRVNSFRRRKKDLEKWGY